MTPPMDRNHQLEVTLHSTVVFALLVSGTCLAGENYRSEPGAKQLDIAKAHYYAAVEGQRGALDEAQKLWRDLRQQYPEHAIVLAYAGSTQLLQAAKTLAVWRKGSLTKEGLLALDDAVARAPESLEVRFVRAASTFHLPGFIGRRSQSKTDFAWLAPRVSNAVDNRVLDRRLGAAVLYHHGIFLQESGNLPEARSAWTEAVRIGQETHAGKGARKRLDQAVQ